MKKGQASIFLDYDQGKISVYHGTDKTLLTSWKEDEDDNHWDLIWNLINTLKGLSNEK
tara:strand:+ start:1928 stop:2101 length:174 start_codon:yes stop_codon:yes gene_type:complete